MLEKKVRPSVFTFNLLLRCTRDCGAGDMKSAQELVSMLGSGQVSSLDMTLSSIENLN